MKSNGLIEVHEKQLLEVRFHLWHEFLNLTIVLILLDVYECIIYMCTKFLNKTRLLTKIFEWNFSSVRLIK